jgi:hypothetical protein
MTRGVHAEKAIVSRSIANVSKLVFPAQTYASVVSATTCL